MTAPSHDPTTPAGRLRLAIEHAIDTFAGRSWDTGPSALWAAVEDAAASLASIDAERIDEIAVLGAWLSPASQRLRDRWARVRRDGPAVIAALLRWTDEVARLASAEDAAIDADCDAAAEHGSTAILHAESGDWPAAVRELRAACALERAYGDCPAWGPALAVAVAEAKAADSL